MERIYGKFRMKITKRTWMQIVTGVGFVVLAICALCVWNKHDFCQGWANFYATRAEEFRAEAANPALAEDQAKEYLIAADLHDIISHKYAAVARQPWRPYPGYPLITPEEQQTAAGKH
jgi:hypothetical protein